MSLTTSRADRSKHSIMTRSLKECSSINLQHASANGLCSEGESHFISRNKLRSFDSKSVNSCWRLGIVSFANVPGGSFLLRSNQLPTSTFWSSDYVKSERRCGKPAVR